MGGGMVYKHSCLANQRPGLRALINYDLMVLKVIGLLDLVPFKVKVCHLH